MLKGVGRSPEAKPPSPLTLQPTPVHFPQCFAPGSPPSHCQQCQPHCPQHCPSASPRIVPGLGVAFPALSPGRLAHSKQSSLRAYPQLCDQQSLVPRTPFPTVSAGTLRLALCGPAPGTSWARCMLRGLALLGPGRCLWHFLGSKKGPQPTWPSCPDLHTHCPVSGDAQHPQVLDASPLSSPSCTIYPFCKWSVHHTAPHFLLPFPTPTPPRAA